MNTNKPEIPPEKIRLAELLMSVRNHYDWSQNKLGREIGTNSNSVSKWLNADDLTMPSAKSLPMILRVVSLLPASNPHSWIKTLDDLNAYLQGSDRAPDISLVQVLRFVSTCTNAADLFDVMLVCVSQAKILAVSPSETDQTEHHQLSS